MLALGKYPEVSLVDARGRRDEARKLLANGVDPSENKKAVKVEHEQEVITFEVVAREWHASNQKWSASHSARVLKSLEDNLFAAIGKRNIADLKTRDLLVPIKAVESSGRLEVAARLQQHTTAINLYLRVLLCQFAYLLFTGRNTSRELFQYLCKGHAPTSLMQQ
ncbi:hypothetical protein VEE54_39750 [Escherichia coli]|nr:hypothetical protein VEE54_39750 [Escherichia coli]BEG36706.1 hypothetical protein VET10_39460 [Escherichia coli]BEG41393.1 hypothetical protein VET2_39370 [Escherichia coli]VVZ63229.1 Prophage CP4-57 integrase [Escherichia coli]VWM97838.1 Prophage CP4-57 integrase [Escherichia coli]